MDRTTQPKKPKPQNATTEQYVDFDFAFRFLNARLFEGNLPPGLITLQRKRGLGGYFAANRFVTCNDNQPVHEIALNPSEFAHSTEKRVLSILAHEMCHLWQKEFGTVGRPKYHNLEWAKKMVSIGLIPSDSGQEGGKMTGDRMNHYIRAGAPFDLACDELLRMGSIVHFIEQAQANPTERNRKRASKSKYICETCDLAVWGKPGLRVRCDQCDLPLLCEPAF